MHRNADLHQSVAHGLVEHTSVGTRNLYSLAPDGLDVVQRWLVDQWDGVLQAFAQHVEESTRRLP